MKSFYVTTKLIERLDAEHLALVVESIEVEE